MECLTKIKIQEYAEGDLSNVETSLIRDHLIVCGSCRNRFQQYEALEKCLKQPVELIPPSVIEKRVMQELFPLIPRYSSIFALIAASFVLLITSIYIYFDFANNSIVQALQLTSNNTSNWIASIVKFISAIFSTLYTSFEILNRFFNILFKINPGAELIAIILIVFSALLFYPLFNLAIKKLKG